MAPVRRGAADDGLGVAMGIFYFDPSSRLGVLDLVNPPAADSDRAIFQSQWIFKSSPRLSRPLVGAPEGR